MNCYHSLLTRSFNNRFVSPKLIIKQTSNSRRVTQIAIIETHLKII
jgi:hypothetical protein